MSAATVGGRAPSLTDAVPPELVAGRILHRRPALGTGLPRSDAPRPTRSFDRPRAALADAVAEGRTDAARSLPSSVVPMAKRVLGERPLPSISAGPRTAEVLRQVGAQAATHDSTIYLDRTLGSDPRSRAVIAHELVHVAHGGDVPRFLGDDADDQEERAAQAAERSAADAAESPQVDGPAPSRQAEAAETGEADGEAPIPAIDVDELMDQLTDKLLVELERRGGRYRGVF